MLEQGKAIKARLDHARDNLAMTASIEALTGGLSGMPSNHGGRSGPSLGREFVESAAYRYIRDTQNNRPQAWQSPVVELHATTLSEAAGSGGPLVIPDQQAGIVPTATRRLVVADLIAPGTTTSNLISFMRETTFTNNAATVAETGTKPESALIFENATSPVQKIAHWIPVTEEILQDISQAESYINGRMDVGVKLAEDDELLNGSGVAPHLKGFLHLTAPTAPIARVAQTNIEVLLQQAAAIELATGLTVDGFVLNPAQWQSIVLLKTTDGAYLSGSPFDAPHTPTLWGRKVAVTSAIPAGTGLVGCFATGGAQLFRHGGMRIDVSNSHSDFFIKNLIAVRAEIREALAVYRDAAFGLVTNVS